MTDTLELSVKIAADVREMRRALRDVTRKLDGIGKAGARGGEKASKGLHKVNAELARTKNSAETVGKAMRRAFAAIGGALLVRNITQTAIQFDRIKTGLQFVAGSAAGAAKEMQFVRDIANGLGLELSTTAQAWTEFAAAAKGTALEGDKAKEIFAAITKASSVMDLSVEQTQGVLLALQQMMSKGTVQAEDLRGQMGERMPGAFQIAAKAMGVTTQELGNMLQKGQVLASDFLPKLAAELERRFGLQLPTAVHSAQSEFNRFANTLTEIKLAFSDSGFLTGVTQGMTAIAHELGKPEVQAGLKLAGEKIGGILKTMAAHPGGIKASAEAIVGVFTAMKILKLIPLGKYGRLIKAITALAITAAVAIRAYLKEQGKLPAEAAKVGDSLDRLDQLKNRAAGGGAPITITGDATKRIKALLKEVKTAKAQVAAYAKELQAGVEIGSINAATAQARLAAKNREVAASLSTKVLPELKKLAPALEEVGRSAEAQSVRTAISDIALMAERGAEGAVAGLRKGVNDYLATAVDMATQTKDVVSRAFSGMEDALVRFVTTGKLSFKSLVDSIIVDLARIAIRKGITGPIAQAFASLLASAKGNAFAGGRALAFAAGGAFTNSVVTRPVAFPLGLMGEAGPEAILPLKRTTGGDLGVSAEGLSPRVEVHVHEAPGQGGQVQESTAGNVKIIDVLVDKVRGALIQDIGQDGPLARSIEAQYGVSRARGSFR